MKLKNQTSCFSNNFYLLFLALHLTRRTEERAASRPSRVLHPEDASIQGTRRSTRRSRLHVVLHSSVRRVRPLRSWVTLSCGKCHYKVLESHISSPFITRFVHYKSVFIFILLFSFVRRLTRLLNFYGLVRLQNRINGC